MSLGEGDLLGGCRIVGELGEGGMGTVYRACQESLGREVALKVMIDTVETADQRARFERETRIHLTLNHPCVVRVYDSGTDQGRDFLVMELVRGRSLEDIIERYAPLPVDKVARIGLDVVEALAYLHARNIVHRDLKPRNVFLTEEGRAKVGDFGLAWSDGATVLTRQGAIVGTVKYLAPESIKGADPGAPADFYALGVFLYRMVTGGIPYEGLSTTDWLKHIMHTVPPRVRTLRADVPAPLDELVARLLLKDPGTRANAAEARAVFAALLPPGEVSSGTIDALPPEPAPRPRITRKTSQKPVVVARAAPMPAARATGLPWGAASALLVFGLTFVAARAALAPAARPSSAPPAGASVSPAVVPSVTSLAPVVYAADAAKDPFRVVHRVVLGKPLPDDRSATAFLVTDPARIVSAALTGSREAPLSMNGAPLSGAPSEGRMDVPPIVLRAGWNVLEWRAPVEVLRGIKLELRVDAARPPPPARVAEMPASFAEREREFWRLLGGGLSVVEAEKLAHTFMRELPGELAPIRLRGMVLTVMARHRRELEKDKASELYLGPAGMLATDSRETRDLAGEGLGWLMSVIDQEPADAVAWAYAAVGLAVLGRLDLSDEALRHAVAAGPEMFHVWYQHYEVAEVARVDGRLDRARSEQVIAALRTAERLARDGSSDTARKQTAGALRQMLQVKPAYR